MTIGLKLVDTRRITVILYSSLRTSEEALPLGLDLRRLGLALAVAEVLKVLPTTRRQIASSCLEAATL